MGVEAQVGSVAHGACEFVETRENWIRMAVASLHEGTTIYVSKDMARTKKRLLEAEDAIEPLTA